MKLLISFLILAAVQLGAVAATSPTAAPKSGSFLSDSITSGSDTNLSLTNCLWVPANGTTNLAASTFNSVNVSGAGAVGIMVELVSDRAAGATNNGWMTFVFGKTPNGGTFTTDTNGFAINVPVAGTRRVVWTTNVSADALGPWAYVRLQTIGHTNLGAYYVSNVLYRFIQTSY